MKIESALYKPFGEQSEWVLPGNAAPETKGWIGERFDADAGLQYLNARYYDPELSLFLQPDWFEVTKAGVGTNRFSYSFNDPVNKFDPGGNATEDEEEYPYTISNGTKAHEVLADYVETDESFTTEDGTYRAEQRIFGGIFDDARDWLNGKYKGQPDASVRTGPASAKFFDWKPVTHSNKPELQAGDRRQQSEWREKAFADGLDLEPASTEFIENGAVAGRILGYPDADGKMVEYEVVAYGSKERGIAYYELRPDGFKRTLSAQIAREISRALQNGPSPMGFPPGLPGPIPIPIPIP